MASHTPSTHRSQPLFATIRQIIPASVLEAPTSHSQAKKQALVRDSYRCMLSGAVDDVGTIPGLEAQVLNTNARVTGTQCSHIFPQHIGHNVTDEAQLQESTNIRTLLHLYDGIEPDGKKIHHLSNILTLETGVHDCFDKLQIWLGPTGEAENQYTIKRREEYHCGHLPQVVTFSSISANLPLPNPRYLALHAACACIIKLSGAAEYIARLLRDAGETKVLSEDGSSGELSHLLVAESTLAVS